MGLFKKDKEVVYPFSGFDGQLLFKGQPAAGAKITRKYEQLGGKTAEETISADQDGHFSFESISIEFSTPLLAPVDYMSHQSIFVHYNNEDIQIWGGGKAEKGEYSEFGGNKPQSLSCELTDDTHVVELESGGIVTRCNWN